VFSAFNLASQFHQLLSNYGVQMEERSHTTGARYGADMHSLMFVSCFSMYGFTFDNNSKNCSQDILNLLAPELFS